MQTFANLIVPTGVIMSLPVCIHQKKKGVYQSAIDKNLTMLVPSGEALKAAKLLDLSKLTNARAS